MPDRAAEDNRAAEAAGNIGVAENRGAAGDIAAAEDTEAGHMTAAAHKELPERAVEAVDWNCLGLPPALPPAGSGFVRP